MGLSLLLNFSLFTSFLIGVGLSFSSTIIIVKLLTDIKDIEKVYGKISMGVLIVQDLVAVIMLIFLSSIANTESGSIVLNLLQTFAFGIFGLIAVMLFSKYVLERLLDWIAESQELLFSFVIAWCLGVAIFFSLFGFSIEVGALIAGIALAASPYNHEISSRIKPLRDFFIILFFILLGSQMIPVTEIPNIQHYTFDNFSDTIAVFLNNFHYKSIFLVGIFSEIFIPALILSLFVLIIKPLIVFITLNLQRFHTKVAFQTGTSLAQISEFSLIMFIAAGQSNLIGTKEISTITLIAILTILFSSYFMTHSNALFPKLHKYLSKIEIRKPKRDMEKKIEHDLDLIIFGYDRIGYSVLKTIESLDKKYLIIDYNPAIIKKLGEKNFHCVYGDVSDQDFIEEFNLENINQFISTIPELDASIGLIRQIRKKNKKASIIVTAHKIDDALELYKEGADYVILPHFLGGEYVSTLIEKYDDNFDNFLDEKIKHIHDLKSRKEHGLEHPKHNK